MHRQRLAFAASVRSKEKKKKKNSKKKARRRTERRRQQQRWGRLQRANIMLYTYTRITCRYDLDKPITQTITASKTNQSWISLRLLLATGTSALLPLWHAKLSVYFHLGEYYWKDFSSPALTCTLVLSRSFPPLSLSPPFQLSTFLYPSPPFLVSSVWPIKLSEQNKCLLSSGKKKSKPNTSCE